MASLFDFNIKAKNYKCIGEDPQGFENICSLNILIGRNNSGKSALLDLIQYTTAPYKIDVFGHKNNDPQIFLTKTINEAEIQKFFPPNARSNNMPGRNMFEYGKDWIGKYITVELLQDKGIRFINVDPPTNINEAKTRFKQLAEDIKIPMFHLHFKRLLSDRDIKPEMDSNSPPSPNGEGATSIIQNFINKEQLDRSLVEVKLLSDLNSIFEPDSSFNRILIQQKQSAQWEIFLEEENKGIIALSNSGSGLKTIILVLIHFILVPVMEGRPLNSYIFAFEELENNVHPALQRRLLNYIREVTIKEKCHVFLSTHSGVIIDQFSNDSYAQIIHVTHNGEYAIAKKGMTYSDGKGILDDLDIRASDLLQSNCVVWVEGPSDRIYFNKWIELWTNGELKEGIHYQCVFYGGRLLSHYEAVEPEKAEGISILNVNRNAIILIDSDKKASQSKLNKSKKRVISEILKNNGLAWVTAGREIENYIPIEALKEYYKNGNIEELGKFIKFSEYLNNIKHGEGDTFLRSKVLFAEKVTSFITKEMLEQTYDLKQRLTETCLSIKKWNNL